MDKTEAVNVKRHTSYKQPIIVGLIVIVLLVLTLAVFYVLNNNDNNIDETDSVNISGPSLEREGDYLAAAKQYEAEAEKTTDQNVVPTLYEQAGDAYLKAEEYDSAKEAYQKAADNYQLVKDDISANRALKKIDGVNLTLLIQEESSE